MAATTIPISKEFHDWLKSKGKKGESYEDVIKRLLKPEFKEELGEEQLDIAGNKDDTDNFNNV